MLRHLFTVGLLNLVQGMPAYFFTVAMPALMRDGGASLATVGLAYVIWLPWALKWLWAPYFDAAAAPPFRSRIAWLRTLPIAMAAVFLAVAAFPPGSPHWPLIVISLVSAAVGATLQVVLAAWLIEALDEKQRALANAGQVAGITLGGIIGGGLILTLGAHLPWAVAIVVVSLLIAALSLPAWLEPVPRISQERPVAAGRRLGMRALLASWSGLFRRPGFARLGLLILLAGGAAGADALLPAIMIDRGFSAAEVGWIIGTLGMACILPASAATGWLVRRFGSLAVLAGLYMAKAAAMAALAMSLALPAAVVAGLVVVDCAISGALMVAMYQLYMGYAAPERAATDYGLLTSLEAALRLAGGLLSGQGGDMLGYGAIFSASALFALAAAGSALLWAPSPSAQPKSTAGPTGFEAS
ncbi:MFS transporter [Bosea sp. TWI1241]|uniref:MFS transporter n=1 Tax=Bosea sp. TWI1241 TaxID=3148904 RepID=UPI0032093284